MHPVKPNIVSHRTEVLEKIGPVDVAMEYARIVKHSHNARWKEERRDGAPPCSPVPPIILYREPIFAHANSMAAVTDDRITCPSVAIDQLFKPCWPIVYVVVGCDDEGTRKRIKCRDDFRKGP
jgi:hypothetical protein